MSESQHLADAIEGFLVDPNEAWYATFPQAVACLTADQAAKIPSEKFNSVWGVVNHMAYWQEYFLMLMRDGMVNKAQLGDEEKVWKENVHSGDETAWQNAIKKVIDVNMQLVEYVESLPDEMLGQPLSEGKVQRHMHFHGVIAHNAYHICEIITIRHMNGYWLEKT
jgi:uncharacterized damage-inducible protein DinB